jgi:carboxymethylenebutenolidase
MDNRESARRVGFTIAQAWTNPVKDGFVEYRSEGRRKGEAYCANPKPGPPLGQVIVIHEVWGFTRFIRDLCDRLSRQGFSAVAPVLFWRDNALFSADRLREGMKAVWGLGLEERFQLARLEAAMRKGRVSSETESMLRMLYDRRFRAKLLRDLLSLERRLSHESPGLRTGVVGFSMGGKLALQLAARAAARIEACVAYSAEPVSGPVLRGIGSPLLLLYGGKDRFMLSGLPDFVKATIANGKDLELKIYRSAGHEFFDETNESGYESVAAIDAWSATVDFLRRRLSRTTNC